jgi:hypothetical protein
MNKGRLIRSIAAIAMTLAVALGLIGCQKQGASADPNVSYYTCTMHPSVKSQDAKAKCPICSRWISCR